MCNVLLGLGAAVCVLQAELRMILPCVSYAEHNSFLFRLFRLYIFFTFALIELSLY